MSLQLLISFRNFKYKFMIMKKILLLADFSKNAINIIIDII